MGLNDEEPILLDHTELDRLDRIANALPILADLSRADILLYRPLTGGRARVHAHARPRSLSPIYLDSLVGQIISRDDEPVIFRPLRYGRPARTQARVGPSSTPIVQDVYPIFSGQSHPQASPFNLPLLDRLTSRREIIGLLSIETNQVEWERHHRRNRIFREALQALQAMVLRDDLTGLADLSPFAEHDGLILVDPQGWICYVSGVAENLYRKMDQTSKLINRPITTLETTETTFTRALEQGRPVEETQVEKGLTWIRKAIPIYTLTRGIFQPPRRRLFGILIAIHDATDELRKEQELRIKSALIQEIHHRVKNNLQTIAALLRLQSRRATLPETQHALTESVNRILSVAVVHEFLSHDEGSVINIKEVSRRIIDLTTSGILDPSKGIQLSLDGDDLMLSPQRATACALVINELVQNAVEHGYADRVGGHISIRLIDLDEKMQIEIADDGEGLPPDFDLERGASLGLRIVQTLVREDLHGHFSLSNGKGVRALIEIPKESTGPMN